MTSRNLLPTIPGPVLFGKRQRATEIPFDAEALVRGVVAKLQTRDEVEADRLRDAMLRAIARCWPRSSEAAGAVTLRIPLDGAAVPWKNTRGILVTRA